MAHTDNNTMSVSRLDRIEALLERMAASTIRNDNLRKADVKAFSGLLHCGRDIDVRKNYNYASSGRPCMYNITVNDSESILPSNGCYCTAEWARGEAAGHWDSDLAKAWGTSKLADVRAKWKKDATCQDVGLPTDEHCDLNSQIYETVLKTKIPELVAVGKGGCIVHGRDNSTIAELLATVIIMSDVLGYGSHIVKTAEFERVPDRQRLVAAVARGNHAVMQAEYDALSPQAKTLVGRHEFFDDRGLA
jgi:hypothetical protein